MKPKKIYKYLIEFIDGSGSLESYGQVDQQGMAIRLTDNKNNSTGFIPFSAIKKATVKEITDVSK